MVPHKNTRRKKMSQSIGKEKSENRWVVAVAGIVLQLILGSVYAWSVFKKPIMEQHGWTGQQVGFTFTLVILFLGLSAAFGGRFVDKAGSKKVATLAGILFGIGTLIGGFANSISNLWLLWLGYGVIAGIGNGLGYITPIAVLVRWFPDKRGLITGLAVMGFGLGAALMGQIAPLLIAAYGVTHTFYLSGITFIGVIFLAAQHLHNPPKDYQVAGVKAAQQADAKSNVAVTFKEALRMNQFYLLWLTLFVNVTAGIALISNLSPLAQSQVGLTAITAGTLILIASLFNGFGRLFWSSLSDKIGRKNTFLIMIVSQIPLFFMLANVTNLWVFSAMCCWIMLCYGGGFATMPAFAADTFGAKNIGGIYGPLLTAWGAAAVVGPMLMEYVKAKSNSFAPAFYIAAFLLTLGVLIISFYRKPQLKVA
jgi:OFA family oxalate/formate antiporter-like MFS transporter